MLQRREHYFTHVLIAWCSRTKIFAGEKADFKGHGEQQQIKLNFSYRFGNTQVKAARQRKNALEEENKRTQGGGGIGVGQ